MWEKQSLGDVCNLTGGGTPSKSNDSFYQGDIPWVTVRDMKSHDIVDTTFKITNEAVTSSSTNVIPAGSVIIATRVGLGKVAIIKQDMAINQDIKAVIPKNKNLSTSYLYWWLRSKSQELIKAGTGATVQGVKLTFVNNLQITTPKIEEQKRIVAILDQAFADIDKARATAERNLKNARELFDRYLQQVFSQCGEGRKAVKLEELVTKDCSLSYGIVQPGLEFDGGLPVVRPTDLASDTIQINGLKRINPVLAESYKRTTLQGGELLLCVRGSTGVISLAASELKGANVTRGIVPIRFASEHMIQKFGYYQFISKHVQEQIREKTYGAALMQINIRDVKKLEFSVPPFSYQNEAIFKLDEMASLVDRLKNVYQDKLNNLTELKKSILQKAFKGELTKSKGTVV